MSTTVLGILFPLEKHVPPSLVSPPLLMTGLHLMFFFYGSPFFPPFPIIHLLERFLPVLTREVFLLVTDLLGGPSGLEFFMILVSFFFQFPPSTRSYSYSLILSTEPFFPTLPPRALQDPPRVCYLFLRYDDEFFFQLHLIGRVAGSVKFLFPRQFF